MEYRVYDQGTRGKKYWRDGKFLKAADVPEDILAQLQPGVPYKLGEPELPEAPPEIPAGVCIFCSREATKQRLVTGQRVDLCTEHYYSSNIGRIVQRMRELKAPKESGHEQGTGQRDTESAGREESQRELQEDRSSQG